jgi:hypothetical protein
MCMQKRSDRCGRAPLRSPVGLRQHRERTISGWEAIAARPLNRGRCYSAGASPPMGDRWFRRAGGTIPFHSLQSSKPLSRRYLSFVERDEIANLRVQEYGVRAIARKLGRTPGTVSRELCRNAATRSGRSAYPATTAQGHAHRSLCRPKQAKLARNEVLHRYVQERLAGAVIALDIVKIKGPLGGMEGGERSPAAPAALAWSRNSLRGACR